MSVERALCRPGIQRSRGRLVKMVALARLVVDPRDEAERVVAKPVLRGYIGIAAGIRHRQVARLDDADVDGPAVRLALDLVQRTVIAGQQRPRHAVRGNAGRTRRIVQVARPLRTRRGRQGRGRDQPRGEGSCRRQHRCPELGHLILSPPISSFPHRLRIYSDISTLALHEVGFAGGFLSVGNVHDRARSHIVRAIWRFNR